MERELLYRYLRGQVTAAEKQQIKEWLEADPVEHRKEFDRARFLFEGMVLYGGGSAEAPTRSRVFTLRSVSRYALRIAAVAALFIGGAYLIHTQTYNTLSNRMATLEIPAGQRVKFTLEDGSTVWLNAGAKLEYPAVFARDVRRVKLTGEAMFEVEHNDKHPFVVETYISDIEVLGTKFNVIADQTCNHFSTALLRGCVRVTNRQTNQQIVMMPNSIVNLENGRLRLTEIDNHDEYLWPEGILSVSGVSFDRIIPRLEKSYGVKIILRRTTLPVVKYKRCKIRVTDGIDHALDILQLASDFTYTHDRETNTITIK